MPVSSSKLAHCLIIHLGKENSLEMTVQIAPTPECNGLEGEASAASPQLPQTPVLASKPEKLLEGKEMLDSYDLRNESAATDEGIDSAHASKASQVPCRCKRWSYYLDTMSANIRLSAISHDPMTLYAGILSQRVI